MNNGKGNLKKKLYSEVRELNDDYGFYISALSLRGKGKKNADLTFHQGLNVISGSSDTGKTFIFECINFIFGGSTVPKKINESKGYTELYIELTTYNGEIFTLKRNLTDKKMYFYESSLNDINGVTPQEIGSKHDKDNLNNISQLLMQKSGATYKNVIYKKAGHTESFSFRDFVHICMLHEKKIINATSPIYTDNGYKKTRSESAFRIIITGMDDSAFEENKKSESTKIKARAKLEIVEDLILKTRVEIEELSKKVKSFTISEFDSKLGQIKKELSEKAKLLDDFERTRLHLWNEIQNIKHENYILTETNKRFNLLKKNYESDIERLEFIEEADYYIGQLIDTKCPVCNSPIDNYLETNTSTAFKAELTKVRAQLNDLQLTIIENQEKILIKNNQINSINEEIKRIDELIKNELKPVMGQFNEELDKLMLLRDQYRMKEYSSQKLEELLNKREELKEIIEAVKVEKEIINTISSETLNLLCDTIKGILEDWKLEEKVTVSYNREANDIIVNGKLKESFGKGYASVINSAFVIGIMQYLIKVGLPHPKVIVLDSPLTAYKEKDTNKDKNDFINEEVKQAFYRNLSQFKQGVQFIVLENVVPSEEIQKEIKHYHFTKNPDYGRYGFIPH